MYTLINYKQIGYGRYRIAFKDANGKIHYINTDNVEAIDAIRAAGREMKSNDDGTYERLCSEFADSLAAMHNI